MKGFEVWCWRELLFKDLPLKIRETQKEEEAFFWYSSVCCCCCCICNEWVLRGKTKEKKCMERFLLLPSHQLMNDFPVFLLFAIFLASAWKKKKQQRGISNKFKPKRWHTQTQKIHRFYTFTKIKKGKNSTDCTRDSKFDNSNVSHHTGNCVVQMEREVFFF